MSNQIDLRSILTTGNVSKEITEIGHKVVDILQPAVNSPTSTKASDLVAQIDGLYSSDYSGNDKQEDFLYTLWTLYIKAAQDLPVDDDAAMRLLVDTATELKGIDRGTVKVWRNKTELWAELPMLAPCMRDAWNFRPEFDESKEDEKKISQWISLNSIAARLLGSGPQAWVYLAVWALREALETTPSNEAARDTGLRVAAQWFTHAGKKLHSEATESQELDEDDQEVLAPGDLFSEGKSGLSEARWAFWRKRIQELGDEAGESGKSAAKMALNAIDNS